jgi:hypothetical protein
MASTKSTSKRSASLQVVVLLLAIVAISACGTATVSAPVVSVPTVQPAAADQANALEDRYGIRITRLALVNFGGTVDFQYLVTDADKANEWMHDEALIPALLDEDSGVQMGRVPFHPMSSMQLLLGRTYHLLLPNTGNAIQPGDNVSVLIDDLSVGMTVEL